MTNNQFIQTAVQSFEEKFGRLTYEKDEYLYYPVEFLESTLQSYRDQIRTEVEGLKITEVPKHLMMSDAQEYNHALEDLLASPLLTE